MSKYPLHAKLKAHEHESLLLSGFLDILGDLGYDVVKRHECNRCSPFCERIYDAQGPTNEHIIGLYLGINPKELSKEKDAMYAELVVGNAVRED